jgi:antitoxin MazE
MGRRSSAAKEKRSRQTISKWGNSLAVRIPAHAADSAGLFEGSEIDIAVKAGTLIIKASRPRRYNLKELVDQITPENRPPLLDWGKPVGKEVW